jgi:choline dehydrogenase-like flavoprotein
MTLDAELAIVGAGPAGIVTALEVAKHGIKVILIESGSQSFDPSVQGLSDAAAWDRKRHAPMSMAVRRQVGGTSVIWGGRCVPYDPVDFEPRPFVGSASWPVSYDQIHEYFQRACDWSLCGRAVFSSSEVPDLPRGIVPGLEDGHVTTSTLERWSLPTNFGKSHRERLLLSPHVRLLTGVTCTRVVSAPETNVAEYLECRTMAGSQIHLRANAYVIACGGLESTRLLLASTGPRGGSLGNESGHLGRWYMAHVEGVAANIHFSTPPRSTVYDYERDIDGVYVRRRFGFTEAFQLEHDLPNISAWLTNPELADARHNSGQLSFVYLALSSPLGPKFAPDAQRLSLTGTEIPGTPYGRTAISTRGAHVRNMVRHPLATGRFIADFGAKRFLSRGRRAPGFFVYSNSNIYPFQYHSEHLPNPDSRVSLSREVDALGMPKLNIDLRFSAADVDGVVRAHRHWDAYLRSSGVGRLEYLSPDVHGIIESRLGGGFHQIGTTRMSAAPADGVVDENLKVHGVENVFVASSSTFVTSGQANSTFMVVAFAVRLADRLDRDLRATPSSRA